MGKTKFFGYHFDNDNWLYQPLDTEGVEKIHQTSMRVLEETGFEVKEDEAFSLFKNRGADCNEETRIVKVKESLVKEILSTAPKTVKLCGKDPAYDVELGKGHSYFSTGGTALNILDYETNDRRPAGLKDLNDISRIVEKMDNIHVLLLPTYPNEIDVEDVDVNRFFSGLCYTDKHIMGGVYSADGIDSVIRMAEDVAGGPEALRERPFISMITCGISPLRIDEKYGKYLIKVAREGIPLAVPVEPLCGATAPITLAGTLVIQNCDGLIHILLSQLANPGTPAIYGSVATTVNLHDVHYLGGPVESGMINAATAQLARYYGLPYYSTAGISDSKTLDVQCGYEAAINNLLVAMSGGDLIHDAAGLMEFATTVSKEKLVIDNEILGMAGRCIEGIRVTDETLAFDTINAAGPGGNFIAQRHTRRHMHREHYTPQLSDRALREEWICGGSKTAADKAHETVTEILEDGPESKLSPETAERIIQTFPQIRKNDFEPVLEPGIRGKK